MGVGNDLVNKQKGGGRREEGGKNMINYRYIDISNIYIIQD